MDRRVTGSLRSLLEPRSVAVVGASQDPSKAGYQMLATLDPFPGRIHPVNPRGGRINEHEVLTSLRDADEEIDLAVIVVPPAAVPDVVDDCVAVGVGAAVVCAGGFAEAGDRGEELQREVRRRAAAGGLRLLGPNTSGLVNPGAGLFASFVPAVRRLDPGGLAIIAQSGGVNHAVAFLAEAYGLGVRLAVGLGNAADIGPADLLDHLSGDPGVDVVALHIEGVDDGRRLVDAVARLTPRVPVVALVVGRADVAGFARSHTGALTRDWAVTRAALRQAGAVVVDDSRELVVAAHALSLRRLAADDSPGVGVVTGQAGPGLLITDALRSAGVDVPELRPATREQLGELLPAITYHRNPVDTGRPGPTFAAVLETVAGDPGVDVVLSYGLHEPAALDAGQVLAAVETGLPLVFGTGGPSEDLAGPVATMRGGGVPVFTTPEDAARAATALVTDARAQHRLASVRAAIPDRPIPDVGHTFDEAEAKALLSSLGVPIPPGRPCQDRDEARAALDELGPPVVVKGLDPSVAHKTERGLVHVGIGDVAELDRALDAIEAAGVHRFLVERAVGDGVELLVGGSRRPGFGPTVLLGLGGVFAEALEDVAVRLAPLSVADAHEMLAELRGRRVLDGFRGLPRVDRDALAEVVVTVGDLLVARSSIVELDINPLRASEEGPVALDVAIVTHEARDRRGEVRGSGGG